MNVVLFEEGQVGFVETGVLADEVDDTEEATDDEEDERTELLRVVATFEDD